jgi:hypothetical protein
MNHGEPNQSNSAPLDTLERKSGLIWKPADHHLYKSTGLMTSLYGLVLIAVNGFGINLMELCVGLGVLFPILVFLGLGVYQLSAREKFSVLACVVLLTLISGLGYLSLMAAAEISASC